MALQIFTTTGDQSGNRYFQGTADLTAAPLEIQLATTPAWIVGAPVANRIVWMVADVNGVVTAFAEETGALSEFPVGDVMLPAGAPPTVLVGGSAVSILQPSGAAPLAGHALVDGIPVTIGPDGTVAVGSQTIAGTTALRDGRIVVSRRNEMAFLASPTDRLTHGVLGDQTEAESVVVLEPGTATIRAVIDAPGDTVFEAISPMWADVTGNGIDDLVVTASDSAGGAALTVYSAAGAPLAAAAPIGTGNRWLNQLAVAPAGPGGAIEIVEVRTPHIGGIVNWYQRNGETLELQASAERYSTHRIGSRNLDQGIVIDAGGDGRLEVVVPTQDQQTLVALTRTDNGTEILASTPLGAALTTNVAAAVRPDGTASISLGTEDGRLLVWP